MSTVVLRSEDALKSRFHANAFGYRPQPPMNPHRRKPPPPARAAAAAVAAAAAPPSPPSHKPNRAAPARTGRKPRPTAGAADELRHHRRRLVMGEVTILKRGDAMKPSAPVPPGSSVGDVPNDLDRRKLGFPAVDPVYAGPGYSVSSPAPSSLPYPGLLLRPLAASEEATRSLLRLLRLNQFAP